MKRIGYKVSLKKTLPMKTHLTYKDGKSDKFWQIETQGNSFRVTYGKTGTAGTSQTKEFNSETTCLKEGEKLVA
jgi:predicted DNA-binding WGR domain protein